MEQYISKSALLAEIEKLIAEYSKCPPRNNYEEGLKGGRLIGYKDALYKINTLEVKEVDLEKEINTYISNNFFGSETLGFFANRTKEKPNDQDIALCAKYFFELGMQARKEEVK